MKLNWNKKYTTIAVYAFLVLAATALFTLAVMNLPALKNVLTEFVDVSAPLIGGVIIAYLLMPLLNVFDKKLFKNIGLKKNKTKLRRALSVLCTYLVLVIILTAFVMLFVPELVKSYHTLMDKYGSLEKIEAAIEGFVMSNELLADNYDKIIEFLNLKEGGFIDTIKDVVVGFFPSIIGFITSFASGVYIVAISLIFSIYVLCYKETLIATVKKIFLALFNKKHYLSMVKLFDTTDDNIGKYIRGKLLGSSIVGVVSYIAYTIFGYEFAPVLAVIAGVTNMIPYFGPFIGGIPAGVIVLIAQPEKLLGLIIIILVLQQLDGNILDPMIVGNNVGLAPVFTMMATIMFGGFFGIPGMFLGVPVFATIYTFAKEKVDSLLDKKNLSPDIKLYYPGRHPEDDISVMESEENDTVAEETEIREENKE